MKFLITLLHQFPTATNKMISIFFDWIHFPNFWILGSSYLSILMSKSEYMSFLRYSYLLTSYLILTHSIELVFLRSFHGLDSRIFSETVILFPFYCIAPWLENTFWNWLLVRKLVLIWCGCTLAILISTIFRK